MSSTFRRGFDGVSIHTSLVRGRIARRAASGLRMSTAVKETPSLSKTFAKSRYVPPYTSSVMTT